jgi:replicative DNA helicase
MRKLVEVGSGIAESAYSPQGRDAQQLLDEAEAKIFQIAESGNRSSQGFVDMKSLLPAVADRIDYLYQRENQGSVTGIPTGFDDLDERTSGFQPGDLIIVAGRPSMGKTAFSLNIAENVALDSKKPVAVFSMEMGATQLATRMIGSVGRLDQHRMRNGNLEDEDWARLTTALGRLNDAPIYIDEAAGLTSFDVRARARRLHRQTGGLGLIVVDYLQLMAGTSSSRGVSENRATEISEISRSLKSLAKELNVPLVALSQLNRSVEQRPDKRPVMSDLRESGAIEQDADLILFIYRDEVYNPDSEDKGTAEIIIAKQRNGPIGRVRLTFLGHHTRFENFASGNAHMGDDY